MIYVLSKYKKNITTFHLKITIFTAVKNRSILHRRVIVMFSISNSQPIVKNANASIVEPLLNLLKTLHLEVQFEGMF